ncbi:MAG: hypothetical protein AB7E42_02825 [Anaerotignaceae bacterium]
MYIRIIDPNISIFNGDTNEFIGSARFNLTPESEKDLLQLVNYNITPKSLLLLNLIFYQQSTYFDPPTLDQPTNRKGILRAILLNDSGEQVPIEIRLRYDAIARGNLTGIRTFFESAEYNNIAVDSIERISY